MYRMNTQQLTSYGRESRYRNKILPISACVHRNLPCLFQLHITTALSTALSAKTHTTHMLANG